MARRRRHRNERHLSESNYYDDSYDSIRSIDSYIPSYYLERAKQSQQTVGRDQQNNTQIRQRVVERKVKRHLANLRDVLRNEQYRGDARVNVRELKTVCQHHKDVRRHQFFKLLNRTGGKHKLKMSHQRRKHKC